MATYSVEVEVSWVGNCEVTYIIVEANSQTEAHQKALKMVNDTLDVRAEVRPLKMEDFNTDSIPTINDGNIFQTMGIDPLPEIPSLIDKKGADETKS